MRERARLAGGKLEIDAEAEQGTRIRLIVPLRAEN
jgi:signal transduction histidine kinase